MRLSIGAMSGTMRARFGPMQSFMPLFINRDLGESLINSTYWSSISNFAWFGGMAVTTPI